MGLEESQLISSERHAYKLIHVSNCPTFMLINELLGKVGWMHTFFLYQQRIQSLEMCLDHGLLDLRRSSSLSESDSAIVVDHTWIPK